MKNPLLDLNFLRRLDLVKDKATFAKVILLTWNEEPVEEIQGKITAGSINIDGASAVRRTCSLTMVSKNINVNSTYWTLKNKFKLEVGVENTIDPNYPEIIWFKQGLFVFTSLNMNVQSNNFTITLNGKDKMCLLNGEVGGSINASTDFGKLEEYNTLENGEIIKTITNIPIVDIIKNSIQVYAGEPIHNIVLNDIENYGLELLEYRSENNLYMPRKILSGEVTNIIVNKKQKYYLRDGTSIYVDNEENQKAEKKQLIYYDRTGLNSNTATKVWTTKNGFATGGNEEAYNIIKIEFGETAGYRRTDLTYPGELVANVGESLVSILDKIKNMFGDFEYFYDIDGRFIFQKKKTYMNTSFNNLITSDNGTYAQDAAHTSAYTYSFEEGMLLTAFTHAPQILNIKNDYSIWGKRKGIGGAELPVHMRYAIDIKPTYYKPLRFKFQRVSLSEDTYVPNRYYIYSNELDRYILCSKANYDSKQKYYQETEEQELDIRAFTDDNYDWREIIYQMALDYFKYNHKINNFKQLIALANPNHYPTGVTGYETYYTDLQGFWRETYHPGAMTEINSKGVPNFYYESFTHQELYNAAREVILEERKFIQEQDIAQLIIDYVYDNFNIIRNNFIESVDYVVTEDPERDLSLAIEKCVSYGFTESTKVIRNLLQLRWEKMGSQDTYDYDEWIEVGGHNGLSPKTCQILKNFKEEKEFLDKYDDVDLSLQIRNALSLGYSENSPKVKSLLSVRWKKMMLLYGKDPYYDKDYLEWMEEEYVKNGESYLYKTYLILYDYASAQEYEYVDEKKIIMTETEKGVIDIVDPYLSFLFLSRQKKINNFGYDSTVVSNENFLKVITTIIKTFEKTKRDFKNSVIEMLEQQLNKHAADYSLELLDYITENYNIRHEMFYVSEATNKIFVENAHIQYLLDMRQEKINEMGDTLFYIDNDLFVTTMLELFETTDDAGDFRSSMEEKLEAVYSPLDKEAYDFSWEIMDYIYKNYANKNKFFVKDLETNAIQVKDQYIQYLLIMRQDKIDIMYDEEFFPQNDIFITILDQAMEYAQNNIVEGKKEKDIFKEQMEKLLNKFYNQYENEDSYDFSWEAIEYICENYSKKNEFFLVNNKIVILDSYLNHLLELRQEKINEMDEAFTYIKNSEFIVLLHESIQEAGSEGAEKFKEIITNKLNKINNKSDN